MASASLLDRQTMLWSAVAATSRLRDPDKVTIALEEALKNCNCSTICPLSNGLYKNGTTDTENNTPSDCISPDVCKRMLSLSEDMNLLVRNITKEAKALVQAEM